MKPYQPSHKIPRSGLLKMALAALLGGATIGGVAYLVSLLFYVMILFPIGIGALGGLVTGWAVKSGKVRHPLAATCFGLLTGFCIYGTIQGLEYWNVLNRATQTIRQEDPSLSQTAAAQVFEAKLKQSTGLGGFPGYLKVEAQKGVTISRLGPAGITIGETGNWIYWLVELAIIQYLVVARPRALAQAAFCENANEWYGQPVRCGNVNPESAERFLELMRADQLAAAGTFINPHIKKVAAGSLEIYTQTATGQADPEAGNVLCVVNSTAVGKNGRLTLQEVFSGILTPSEYDKFIAALSQASDSLDHDEITYQEHDLDGEQIADIVKQLKNYTAIQAAYLLKISEIGGVPLTETYQLGIIFDRKYINTDQDKSLLLNDLSSEMDTPGEAYVTLLNDDPASLQAIRQVTPQPVYHK